MKYFWIVLFLLFFEIFVGLAKPQFFVGSELITPFPRENGTEIFWLSGLQQRFFIGEAGFAFSNKIIGLLRGGYFFQIPRTGVDFPLRIGVFGLFEPELSVISFFGGGIRAEIGKNLLFTFGIDFALWQKHFWHTFGFCAFLS